MIRFLATCGLLLASLTVVSAVATAAPAPNVTSEGYGRWSKTNLDLVGQGERKDPSKKSAIPVKAPAYPQVTRKVLPECDYVEEGCIFTTCPTGQQKYVVVTERVERQGAVPLVGQKAHCGLPDQNVETLAVHEFYQTEIKVPAPRTYPVDVTLANFPSVFSTDFTGYEHRTGIQNADVRLKFIPIAYRWNFGDGTSLITTDPGKPYDPVLINRVEEIEQHYKNTHRYKTTGKFQISLTITFNGQYSVNHGGWQHITGSLQATSPTKPFTVKEARGELVTGRNN